jgi:hypothetical protein
MIFISLITYYEVLNYDFSEEELMVRSFLDGFEILAISKNIINKALQNRKVKKIKICQIVMVLGWVKFYSLFLL